MRTAKSNKTSRGLSIRVKWLLFICLAVLLGVGSTVIFNSFTISNILQEDNKQFGNVNSKNAEEHVNLNLTNYKTSINQLASIVSAEIKEQGAIPRVEKYLQSLQESNQTLIAVYYMDFQTGNLHISPHADYDADVRDSRTYAELKKEPTTKWMDVYEDKITKKMMTSIVSPIISNGEMVGALGFDIDLSTIGTVRENIESQSDNELIILDSKGIIVSSFMENGDGKNINPTQSGVTEGVTDLVSDEKAFKQQFDWVENAYSAKNSDKNLEFKWEGKEYTTYITTVPEVNWKVISLTPNELFAAKMNKFYTVSLLSVVLGLVIGVFVAVFLAGVLKKIISQFQAVLEKTSSGDLVTEFVADSQDEIGQLAISYNDMLRNMRGLIKTVGESVHSINKATKGLTVIADENNSTITEVTRSIDEIAIGAGNQSEEIERGSTAIYQLSHEIEGLLQQSSMIQLEVVDASEQLSKGNREVQNLEDSYAKLETAFVKVTETIDKLDEKSKMISKVTHAIAQIAEQTNLLSLNASIEAARAGEHGKGFSVVANEVRSLAEESKKATQDIQMTINSVLEETSMLVAVMKETNDISKNQKSAVTTVSSSINQLTDSLNKMMSSIENETKSINRITEEKDQVVGMIEGISAVSQETTASTEEIASAMEEQASSVNEVAEHAKQLALLLGDLNEAVMKFDIKR